MSVTPATIYAFRLFLQTSQMQMLQNPRERKIEVTETFCLHFPKFLFLLKFTHFPRPEVTNFQKWDCLRSNYFLSLPSYL